MKLTRSSKILVLTGSACSLLALAAITSPLLSSSSYAESTRRKPLVQSYSSEPEQPAVRRTPQESLAKGLEWLLAQQHQDGGWGQGGGWRQGAQGGGRVEGAQVEDPSDLGNTCVSVMAVMRALPTLADESKAREALARGLDYLCAQVEKADQESLWITPVRDTQLQVKIGSYVDTFLTGWALSELKGKLADEPADARRATALEKVVSKIERNQQADGSFANNRGWAAVISQGLASKALNGAARSGTKVSEQALAKDQLQNTGGLDVTTGAFSPAAPASEPSSAGVEIYREASKLAGLRAKQKSNEPRKAEAQRKLADASVSQSERSRAESELKQFDADEKAAVAATAAVSGKLKDSRYVAGFGNNGGEEFLTYMNLTESMHEKGGPDWTDWRAKMHETLGGAQNADGSWAGHHCITGRTFCTGAALLTLLVEHAKDEARTTIIPVHGPAPVAAAE